MSNLVTFFQNAIVIDRTIQGNYPELYDTFNRVEVLIQQAWQEWDHDGDKNEEPTNEFSLEWIANEDFEADGFDVEEIESLING